MAYFPMFVNLDGKHVLVVGGGTVAARRVKTLLDFGCRITVVSPELVPELSALAEDGRILWKNAHYSPEIFREESIFFVLAAANGQVNGAAVKDCRERRIPVNDASVKENCDFYFPGIAKEKETVIGVTAGGGDHKLAAALTKGLKNWLPEFIRKTWQA